MEIPPRLRQAGREVIELDRAVYAAVHATPTPQIDRALARVSRAADRSVLWMGVAAAMAATGPRRRRAAMLGMVAVGATSATVNLLVKQGPKRRRPSLEGSVRTHGVRMPASHSWPSGHTASAFAFSTAAGAAAPELDTALRLAATVVAYSRVHTGVHYAGDVMAGAFIGASMGSTTFHLARAVARRRADGGSRFIHSG
ncbi:phosphatase PAP2 family protein [Terrabacter sp. NPDC080008]|uniref:phosphatase PAP2 family protein n=1 Tax=Terrabacter sp. NPDC080008 TaxID=3155176 RepID=UPI00344B1901